MPADNSAEPRPPNVPLRRADQVAIALLALFALVAISAYWFSQAKLRGRLIDIDRTAPPVAEYRVDINSADWPALIELPGLGETLAKRIIKWRETHMVASIRSTNCGMCPESVRNGWKPGDRFCGPLFQSSIKPIFLQRTSTTDTTLLFTG